MEVAEQMMYLIWPLGKMMKTTWHKRLFYGMWRRKFGDNYTRLCSVALLQTPPTHQTSKLFSKQPLDVI
jgi:hypothetical protein